MSLSSDDRARILERADKDALLRALLAERDALAAELAEYKALGAETIIAAGRKVVEAQKRVQALEAALREMHDTPQIGPQAVRRMVREALKPTASETNRNQAVAAPSDAVCGGPTPRGSLPNSLGANSETRVQALDAESADLRERFEHAFGRLPLLGTITKERQLIDYLLLHGFALDPNYRPQRACLSELPQYVAVELRPLLADSIKRVFPNPPTGESR